MVNFIAVLGWTPPSHHSSSAHQPTTATQKDDNSNEKASVSSVETNQPQEIFSLNELVEQFSLEGLNKRPLTVSKKLQWINKKHFMRKLEDSEELRRLALRLQEELRRDHNITKW